MVNKGAIAVVTGLGAVVATAVIAGRAKASPQGPEPGQNIIPTADDILGSQNMGELEIWYMYIGQLYFTGQIDRQTYETLYQAYVTRFYELIGASQ